MMCDFKVEHIHLPLARLSVCQSIHTSLFSLFNTHKGRLTHNREGVTQRTFVHLFFCSRCDMRICLCYVSVVLLCLSGEYTSGIHVTHFNSFCLYNYESSASAWKVKKTHEPPCGVKWLVIDVGGVMLAWCREADLLNTQGNCSIKRTGPLCMRACVCACVYACECARRVCACYYPSTFSPIGSSTKRSDSDTPSNRRSPFCPWRRLTLKPDILCVSSSRGYTAHTTAL